METILNLDGIENAMNNNDGSIKVDMECSKMLLELAKAERSFSLFLEYLDDRDAVEKLQKEFEYLRKDCIVESVKKTMICCY